MSVSSSKFAIQNGLAADRSFSRESSKLTTIKYCKLLVPAFRFALGLRIAALDS